MNRLTTWAPLALLATLAVALAANTAALALETLHGLADWLAS